MSRWTECPSSTSQGCSLTVSCIASCTPGCFRAVEHFCGCDGAGSHHQECDHCRTLFFSRCSVLADAGQVTAAEILPDALSIGVTAGKIACIAQTLQPSAHTKVIDAEGAYVTPGGVDSHCHIAQDNAPSGDTWETGSRSAIAGGNTTLLAFASQKRHETSLLPVVEEYHRRSKGQAYCDYGFHLILSNPTENILTEELPTMMAEGISSVKLYMTYEPLKLGDDHLMEVMMRARTLGMTTMIHCENSEMIEM